MKVTKVVSHYYSQVIGSWIMADQDLRLVTFFFYWILERVVHIFTSSFKVVFVHLLI